jgi:hypothetical protein
MRWMFLDGVYEVEVSCNKAVHGLPKFLWEEGHGKIISEP